MSVNIRGCMYQIPSGDDADKWVCKFDNLCGLDPVYTCMNKVTIDNVDYWTPSTTIYSDAECTTSTHYGYADIYPDDSCMEYYSSNWVPVLIFNDADSEAELESMVCECDIETTCWTGATGPEYIYLVPTDVDSNINGKTIQLTSSIMEIWTATIIQTDQYTITVEVGWEESEEENYIAVTIYNDTTSTFVFRACLYDTCGTCLFGSYNLIIDCCDLTHEHTVSNCLTGGTGSVTIDWVCPPC